MMIMYSQSESAYPYPDLLVLPFGLPLVMISHMVLPDIRAASILEANLLMFSSTHYLRESNIILQIPPDPEKQEEV